MGGLLVVCLLAVALLAPMVVGAAPPVDVNPGCSDTCPGTTELKLEGATLANGTTSVAGGTITVSNLNVSGGTFDWSSTVPVYCVIVKGGSGASVYTYPGGSYGATGLQTPINPSNSKPYGVSHISFCYGPPPSYEPLTATKTAATSYTRTYTWTIDKSVDPATHTGFAGDSFTSDYDIVLDQTVVESDFAVSGTMTVTNSNSIPVNFTISDSVDGTAAAVVCPVTGTNSGTVAANSSTTCTYSAALAGKADGTNTATITSNTTGVGGTTASAGYVFGDPTSVVGYPTVNVIDSIKGAKGSVSGDFTFEYTDSFTCPTDASLYSNGFYSYQVDNVATIVETGQSDNASVTVNCYRIGVSKDAQTSYTRTWTWDIEKVGDQTDLVLAEGQTFLVNYDVTVDAEYADSGWAASGSITVTNPAPMAANLTSVADAISGGITATVDCPSLTVPAGGSLTCTYSAALPDATARTNTATVTFNGVAMTATADVTFGAPTTEVDECIDVDDSLYGSLGTVCADQAPYTFEYSYEVGEYGECGEYWVDNIAEFVTNDTGAIGSDDWTVVINVPCDETPVLEIAKTAVTSFTRTYQWAIQKWAENEIEELMVPLGQKATIPYEVLISSTGYVDSGWKVSGTVTVQNTGNGGAYATITDVLTGSGADIDITASLVCDFGTPPNGTATIVNGGANSGWIPAGGSVTCTYEHDLPNGLPRTNVASVTAPEATSDQATAPVQFGAPTTEIDRCVDVTDTPYGDLGQVCIDEVVNGAVKLTYTVQIGPFMICGKYEFPNVATFIAEDSKTEGSASWTVIVDVPCEGEVLGSIAGMKYRDLSGNGVSVDDLPLAGWTIELWNDANGDGAIGAGDTLAGTKITGADGAYSFTGLKLGSYVVVEKLQPGWTQTVPASGGYAVTLVDEAGKLNVTGKDFYNYLPPTVTPPTLTPTPTATNTATPTNTPTATPTATNTPAPGPTVVPSPTPTVTNTPAPGPTNTPAPGPTNTPGPQPGPTNTPVPPAPTASPTLMALMPVTGVDSSANALPLVALLAGMILTLGGGAVLLRLLWKGVKSQA